MDIIYALVPLSILLIGIAVLVFFWAVKNGQFDDLDSPAHRILFDDEDQPRSNKASPAGQPAASGKETEKHESGSEPSQKPHD